MTEHDHYTLPNESMDLCNQQVITSQKETAATRQCTPPHRNTQHQLFLPPPKKNLTLNKLLGGLTTNLQEIQGIEGHVKGCQGDDFF